jgi:glycosyltransferase involved in cell wall biosynthesis
MPVATVVLPTHDHSPLLRLSLRTVQEQTVQDIEIFVIGDGVPDETRELVAEIGRDDPRVRFFDNPKGPRSGEVHRAAALAEAGGEIVCYQSDDDLWCPDQVAEVRDLLTAADFAHTVVLSVAPDGLVTPCLTALEAGVIRAFMLRGTTNFLPLSGVGHTLAAYRALPFGWRTTPRPIWTDLYMWQQFLEQPGLRFASGSRPGVFNFPSPARRTWTLADRLSELERWYVFMAGPMWREREPSVSLRCADATTRLRRRLRALEPLAGHARSSGIVGKAPRRLGWELRAREVRSLTRWLASELPPVA